FDQPLVGVGRIVLEEGRYVLGGRRQADQVKGDPADQGHLLGRRRRRQAVRFEAGEDEPIDWRGGPVGVVHRGGGGGADRPEGPERSGLLRDRGRDGGGGFASGHGSVGRGVGGEARAGRGPRGSPLDPFGQRGDLGVLEFALGGHLHVAVVADRLD